MRKVFLFALIMASLLRTSVAQTSAPPGIFADSVYHSVALTSDIVYGSNFNPFYNKVDTLKLDIYEPDSVVDYLRPVLIYVHGGGFTGGDKTTDKAAVFGNYFAKCGYLYASINYRLYIDDNSDTIDNFRGVYMCTQDAMSAVRFFRKHASEYCVDTSKIFLIGTSAGGAICLNTAYWDQYEADLIFDTAPFGPLNNSSGNEGYSSQPAAVVSAWGGITDTAWLDDETTANQLFHGTEDPVVPYVYGYAQNGVYLYGSYAIHEGSLNNNIESYLHPFYGAGHGVPVSSPQFDTIVQTSADFLFAHLSPGQGSVSCGYTLLEDEGSIELIDAVMLGNKQLLIQNRMNRYFRGTIHIFSALGTMVDCRAIGIAPGSGAEVDCTSLLPGLYWCRAEENGTAYTSEFVVTE